MNNKKIPVPPQNLATAKTLHVGDTYFRKVPVAQLVSKIPDHYVMLANGNTVRISHVFHTRVNTQYGPHS